MTGKYSVEFSDKADKALSKMDPFEKRTVLAWIENRLEGCDNPRAFGKGLHGEFSDFWRYRIGDYRVIAKILDDRVVILILDVGHRSKIYD